MTIMELMKRRTELTSSLLPSSYGIDEEIFRLFLRFFPQVTATMGRDELLLDDLDILDYSFGKTNILPWRKLMKTNDFRSVFGMALDE